MASRAGRHHTTTGRSTRRTVAFAMTAALLAASGLAMTSLAGPAGAAPPAGNGPVSTATVDDPKLPNPNADDDAVKDVCLPATDHSAENGSPKENDQAEPCTPPPPPPPPAPVSVAVVEAATVPAEPVDLLPCGETITTDGKGLQPDVSLTRLNDADKTASNYCDPFPYDLKSIPDGLRFLKPTGYPLSQFFVDVTWHRTWDELDEIPTVDFEAVEGGYPVELSECPAGLRDPETGEVVGVVGATEADLADLGIVDLDGSPSVWNPEDNGLTQFACIADTNPVFEPWGPSGAQWTIYQRLYLLGDVIFRG
jgi:hypothetical protein